MEKKKIAFIICTNNRIYLDECIYYINKLNIPEEMSVDILSLSDSKSMAAGYNEMMKQSDAKYKVYMHQDVFIINKNFISDLVDIFNSDKNIGIVGMLGYTHLSQNYVMWKGKERIGSNPMYGASEKYINANLDEYVYSLEEDGYADAKVMDGFLLATCVDFNWDEDKFDGWDFYDADQCMNFLLKGYRAVVPVQRIPWCIHDDGEVLTLGNYRKYRTIFGEKYKDTIPNEWLTDSISTDNIEETLRANEENREYNLGLLIQMRQCIDSLCVKNDAEQIKEILNIMKDGRFVMSGEANLIVKLIRTYGLIGDCKSYRDYSEHYQRTVISLRRLELNDDSLLNELLAEGINYELAKVIVEDGIFEKREETLDRLCLLSASRMLDYNEYRAAYYWLSRMKNRSEEVNDIICSLKGILGI